MDIKGYISLTLISVILSFTVYVHMERVKMDMVKEYVSTSITIDTFTINSFKRIEAKQDSILELLNGQTNIK